MPQVNKYEIRSEEVQKIMRKPPHLLILWGNTFILLIVLSCLLFLNMIKLPIFREFPIQVQELNKNQIQIRTQQEIDGNNYLNRSVILYFDDVSEISESLIKDISAIDSVTNFTTIVCQYSGVDNISKESFHKGSIGRIKVKMGERGLFESIFSKFR